MDFVKSQYETVKKDSGKLKPLSFFYFFFKNACIYNKNGLPLHPKIENYGTKFLSKAKRH